MAEYKGTVELIGGLTPKNNGEFALMHVKDIQVDSAGTRLDKKLRDLEQDSASITVTVERATGMADYSPATIYELVQAGNTVVAVIPDTDNHQYQYDGAVLTDGACTEVKFIHTEVDENGKATTQKIIINSDSEAVHATQLAAGGGTVTITIDGEGNANLTSNEIYKLVKEGTTVVAVVEGLSRLYQYSGESSVSESDFCDLVAFTCTEVNSTGVATTFGLSVDASMKVETWSNNTLDWFGKGVAIPKNSDLDTYETPGKYYAQTEAIAKSLTNRPDGMNTNFVLFVFLRTNNVVSQLMITLAGKMYIRSTSTTSWRSWVSYATSEEFLADTPDYYEGETDTEKLQACFDALATTGGTITLNRKYTLEGNITITHNSDLNNRITVIGAGKGAAIDMGGYSFVGTSHSTGGVTFQNVTFTGSGNLVDATYLIRLTFDNCTISGFPNVFESEDETTDGTGGYMQSIYLTNCLIRSVSGYIFKTPKTFHAFLYDCKVLSCVIEWSGGIAWCGCMQGCSFSHNCVEGMKKDIFYVYCHINQGTIAENYLEANAGQLINLSNPADGVHKDAYHVLTITNNNFFPTERTTATIVLPTTMSSQSRILIYGNKMTANSTVPLVQTEATELLTGVFCYGNYGVIIDPNRVIVTDFVERFADLENRIIALEYSAGDVYLVSKNLTNCTISNGAKTVARNRAYSATITANNGYTLDGTLTPAKAVLLPGYRYSSTDGFISDSARASLIVPIVDEQISDQNQLTITLDGLVRDTNYTIRGATADAFYGHDGDNTVGMFPLKPLPNSTSTTTTLIFQNGVWEDYVAVGDCDVLVITLQYSDGANAGVSIAGKRIDMAVVDAPADVNKTVNHESGTGGYISVTMGGEPVTVNDGVISIPSVTDNIVITARAAPETT